MIELLILGLHLDNGLVWISGSGSETSCNIEDVCSRFSAITLCVGTFSDSNFILYGIWTRWEEAFLFVPIESPLETNKLSIHKTKWFGLAVPTGYHNIAIGIGLEHNSGGWIILV